MMSQSRGRAFVSRSLRSGVATWVVGLALAPIMACGGVASAQAPGAGISPTPLAQPSAAIPAQSEGSPGYQSHGFSGSGPNVTGPAGGVQDNGAASVQEVVVTARRVAENLQNVPLSVTAIGARQLDVLQIRQASDLQGVIPDVSVQKTATAGSSIVYIRGISSESLPNIALDNRVGFYLDGVYIARTEGNSFALADIQQVEALKGPQGTLFGKNVTGGAINFITQAPTGKLGGDVEAGFGDYSRERFKGTINLPEAYGFSARITYAYDARDGDVKNLAAGQRIGSFYDPATNKTFPNQPTDSTLGGFENQSVFAAVRYKGISHLTVDYKFDYAQDYESEVEDQVIGFPGSPTGCVGAYFFLGGPINCNSTFMSLGMPVINAATSHPSVSFNKLSERYVPGDATDLVKNFGNNLTLQYEFSPTFSVKSITAYRQLHVQVQNNTSGGDYEAYNDTFNNFSSLLAGKPGTLPTGGTSFYPVSFSTDIADQHQFSEEIQGIGRVGHVLDYVAGLYYFDESATDDNPFVANAVPYLNYGIQPAFVPPNGIAPMGLPPATPTGTTILPASAYLNGEAARVFSQSAAAYLHVTGHVGDKIDLSAGVRYSADYKSQTVSSAIQAVITDPTTNQPVPAFRSVSFGHVTYDGTATYRFTPDINVYFRYATAYLAGGLFRNIEFKPEDAKSEEIGVKSQFFNHKLQIDGALFHQKDTNYQDNNINSSGALFVANVGSLTTQGVELSSTYVPIRGVTLGANGAYANQDYSDGRPPAAPRLTLQFSAQYDTPRFSNDSYLSFEADANYRSNYHSIPYALSSGANSTFTLPAAVYQAFGFNTQAAYLDYLDKQAYDGGYWNANARVSLLDIPVDGLKGRLSGFVTNLFDDRSAFYTQNYGLAIGSQFQADRTYGVDLAIAF